MKHFLPLITILVVAAPVAAEERFYFFNPQIIQETYERLMCQASPDFIDNRLQEDGKLESKDPRKMPDGDRNILLQCLPRLRKGERFDLSENLRKQLMVGLRLIKANCPKNLKPLSLNLETAKEWGRQLRTRGFFEEKLRNELLTPLYFAIGIPACGTVTKSSISDFVLPVLPPPIKNQRGHKPPHPLHSDERYAVLSRPK